ncbi:MAG: S1 RNA-binding domain-containing protein [Candidatus Uhrbacteria bacterium]
MANFDDNRVDTNTTTNAGPDGATDFAVLLGDRANFRTPKVGDIVQGIIVGVGRNEVKIDIPGFRTGMIRGPELNDPSGATIAPVVGTNVEATVLELENERGFVECSFRLAGHHKAWDELSEFRRSGKLVVAKVIDANKGGLIVEIGRVQGFLPVSQLSPGNYPRVTGGDKQKIFEKLRSFIGKSFDTKIIDVDKQDEKLICSEKAAWEETQSQVLAHYKANDIVEGAVTALADFGAFIRFPIKHEGEDAVATQEELEGLAHISELSWQRVEHPRDMLQIGQVVRAQIINIDKSKIYLSLKRLTDDPWVKAAERYSVGQRIEGKIVRVQPFGLFVELDPDIQGLAHISELGDSPTTDPGQIAKVNDVRTFTIISIDPKEHRLGLSLKSNIGDQKSEIGDQKSEIENQKLEIGEKPEAEKTERADDATMTEPSAAESEDTADTDGATKQ